MWALFLLFISGLCFSVPTSSLFLTPTLVRYLCQREEEAVRHTSMHYFNLGCLCKKKANQCGGAPAPLATPGAHVILSSQGREGGSHRLLSRGCCTWSTATLLLLHWSQTRRRTSLLPDGAEPGPDPVSGTQSTKNVSVSACHTALWGWAKGMWTQDSQTQNQGFWQGGSVEQTSHGPSEKRAASSNSSKRVLALKHRGWPAWAPGLLSEGVPSQSLKWPRIFMHLTTAPEFLKKLGYSSGNAVEMNAFGDLSFIYTLHGIENQLSISKTYFY